MAELNERDITMMRSEIHKLRRDNESLRSKCFVLETRNDELRESSNKLNGAYIKLLRKYNRSKEQGNIMDKIRVVKHNTGEAKDYIGKMMVAPNGVVFIKNGSRVVLALSSDNFSAEVI